MDPSRYLAQYLAPLPTERRPGTSIRDALALPDHHFHPVQGTVEAPDLTMPQLYVAGVECGHGEARSELKRRVGVVAAQLDEYRAIRDRAQGDRQELAAQLLVAEREYLLMQVQAGPLGKLQNHNADLESALAAARHRIDEIELSTTWRMTASIRAAGHRAKILLARGRAAWSDVRQLPRRAGLARSILRDEGPAALAQRVRSKVTRENRFQPAAVRRVPARGSGAPARSACARDRRAAGVDHHPGLRQAAPDLQLPQEHRGAHAGGRLRGHRHRRRLARARVGRAARAWSAPCTCAMPRTRAF